MRIRGVIVLLATLVVVLGALASVSLVLTGKVIEAEEGVSSSVAETSIDESPPVLFEPTLSEISGFKVRFTRQSGILLEWNVSSDASHVVIWRAYSSEGPWFIRKVISTNTLVPRSFYLDRDLMTSTRYYYRMQAINGQELSPFTETRSLYVMYTEDGVETSVSETDPRYGSPEFWSKYIGECGSSKSVACVSRDREGTCTQTSLSHDGECERRLKLYNEFRITQFCKVLGNSPAFYHFGCTSLSPRTFSTGGGSGSGGGSGGGNENEDCFTAEGERSIETDVIECQPQQPPQPLTPPSPNDPSSPGGGGNGGGGGEGGNTPTPDYSCHDATARRLMEEGKLPWTPCPKKNETEKNETNQTELNETRSISELLDLWEVEYWENIDKIHSNDSTTLEEKQKESLIAYREWIDKSSNTAIGNRTALYLEGLAYEKLGTELEKQGRLEEAKKAYENAWKACENAAAGFEIKSETNEYAARACAARNAFRHAALFGPEGGVLDEKYDSRKRSEKLYEELAKDIEAIEDPEIKEKLLPIALEAYVGLAQSKMLGGDIRAADDAIEQLERLAPDHAVTKKVRSIFERALINFIMKTLENSESNANDLLSQKLRTDDGMLSLIAQTGLIDAWDGAQATAADLRNALLGEELGNKLESLLPLGSIGMSKSDLEIITTAVAQENFKLTDQEIGFSFMKLALEDGRALKELQGLSVEQISDVFGLDLVACSEEECASALKRAEYIHNKLQNAFENPDVQQYLNDIDGHAFQFENDENYINGDLLAELSGGVSSSDSGPDLYLRNVKKLANDMTSVQGVALGFGPFATLGKLSVSISAGSRTFTLVGMAEHSLASVVLGSGGSVTSALYKTTKSLFTSIDDSAVLTQSVLAVERTHLLTNEMARHSPNAVKEFFSEVAEEVVPEAIGMGANVVAPGSGAIVELIGTAVELAPLTHVGGKARNAGEAAGMAVTSGNSNNRKLGVDFVKTEFFDTEQRKLVTKYVPEFETETRKLDDTVIFYNPENGKTLGKSTRTAFTIHGDPIPIIEFNNQQAFNQYTQNLQTAQNGMYQLNDGSYVIVYVKGNLPSVLPDAKANTLLLKGGKEGDSLMMIGEPVDDASLSFISTGLIEEDARLYSRSEVENVYLYLPPIDSRFGIVGVTPNSLFVQKANAEIDALVEAGVIKGSSSGTSERVALNPEVLPQTILQGDNLPRAAKILREEGGIDPKFQYDLKSITRALTDGKQPDAQITKSISDEVEKRLVQLGLVDGIDYRRIDDWRIEYLSTGTTHLASVARKMGEKSVGGISGKFVTDTRIGINPQIFPDTNTLNLGPASLLKKDLILDHLRPLTKHELTHQSQIGMLAQGKAAPLNAEFIPGSSTSLSKIVENVEVYSNGFIGHELPAFNRNIVDSLLNMRDTLVTQDYASFSSEIRSLRRDLERSSYLSHYMWAASDSALQNLDNFKISDSTIGMAYVNDKDDIGLYFESSSKIVSQNGKYAPMRITISPQKIGSTQYLEVHVDVRSAGFNPTSGGDMPVGVSSDTIRLKITDPAAWKHQDVDLWNGIHQAVDGVNDANLQERQAPFFESTYDATLTNLIENHVKPMIVDLSRRGTHQQVFDDVLLNHLQELEILSARVQTPSSATFFEDAIRLQLGFDDLSSFTRENIFLPRNPSPDDLLNLKGTSRNQLPRVSDVRAASRSDKRFDIQKLHSDVQRRSSSETPTGFTSREQYSAFTSETTQLIAKQISLGDDSGIRFVSARELTNVQGNRVLNVKVRLSQDMWDGDTRNFVRSGFGDLTGTQQQRIYDSYTEGVVSYESLSQLSESVELMSEIKAIAKKQGFENVEVTLLKEGSSHDGPLYDSLESVQVVSQAFEARLAMVKSLIQSEKNILNGIRLDATTDAAEFTQLSQRIADVESLRALQGWLVQGMETSKDSLTATQRTELANIKREILSSSSMQRAPFDALRHMELAEQFDVPGQISPGAASTVRNSLINQLEPHREKLSPEQKTALDRAQQQVAEREMRDTTAPLAGVVFNQNKFTIDGNSYELDMGNIPESLIVSDLSLPGITEPVSVSVSWGDESRIGGGWIHTIFRHGDPRPEVHKTATEYFKNSKGEPDPASLFVTFDPTTKTIYPLSSNEIYDLVVSGLRSPDLTLKKSFESILDGSYVYEFESAEQNLHLTIVKRKDGTHEFNSAFPSRRPSGISQREWRKIGYGNYQYIDGVIVLFILFFISRRRENKILPLFHWGSVAVGDTGHVLRPRQEVQVNFSYQAGYLFQR